VPKKVSFSTSVRFLIASITGIRTYIP
jgi:hypothetical protein